MRRGISIYASHQCAGRPLLPALTAVLQVMTCISTGDTALERSSSSAACHWPARWHALTAAL
eukprot:10219470-Alexandrium_andersonii.AAC.2